MIQRNATIYWLASALLLPSLSTAFVLQPTRLAVTNVVSGPLAAADAASPRQSATLVMMSADDDDDDDAGEQKSSTTGRRRRRKRKVTVEDIAEDAKPAEPAAPVIELKPRDDTSVDFQVKDVREVVGGYAPVEASTEEASWSLPNPFADSSSPSAPSAPTTSRSVAPTTSDDSLEQLLADARQMREEQGEVTEGSSDGGIKGTIRNVLSTIVTADFFVVCAFLLWFLAGIFCSSVLKDDTVQILFNNNFEKLVQPALGVLMIASVAGNFLQEEEEGM